jgi:hypothetical protein
MDGLTMNKKAAVAETARRPSRVLKKLPELPARDTTASEIHGQSLAALYEADETAWLDESSRLIRAGRIDELDYENLATYLEDQAKRDRREVNSRLRVLVAHLLKWQYRPEKRSRGWAVTVIRQRLQLKGLLESATLQKHAEAVLTEIYPGAMKIAAVQTGVPPSVFPADCPLTVEQVMTEELAGKIP